MIKVIILYNVIKSLPYGTTDDLKTTDLTTDAHAIKKYLEKEGFTVGLFELSEKSLQKLSFLKTDVFFNLCYGIGSLPNSEYMVPQVLEKMKVAYTGSCAQAILLTTDKAKTKFLLQKNHIPTPNFQVVQNTEYFIKKTMRFPLFVKPAKEDSSCGISQQSVVRNANELKKQVQFVLKEYEQPALIEEYIDGKELRVSVLGNGKNARVLPISEISFQGSYKNKWPIVDFAAKWDHDADKDTPGHQAKLSRGVYKKIESLALKAYHLCGCTDYADIDIRLKGETPFFIEINCNPGIAPTDGMDRLANAAGLTYGEYLKQIVLSALARKKDH